MKAQSKYRRFVVGIFFLFMLLHQSDKLLIGPLTTPIMKEFAINRAQMGLVTSGALLIPIASANVIATVYDITLPEVRSTALSVQYLIESSGAALAPGMAGLIADRTSLGSAFLLICVSTWILCGIFFGLVAWLVPADIKTLRAQMAERAARARNAQVQSG
ncbi:MAG: hypothetical protein B6D39_12465 [Anaerolineae bacterium UTCFX2]|jgi:fucose permease|nr:hypothetical protein [Anaerolineae bacterium]MCZ7552599.1 hypothetical protein [Anaerolineales bacterium]OQY87721.1 MAG: hypothetical protein B6D39_12465 [Anaerolineae bacterium UTCFX2]